MQQSLVEGCWGRSPTQKIFTAPSLFCRCSERTQKNKKRGHVCYIPRPKHLKRFTSVLQELQELIEKHRCKNEAWLRARAEENDRERRELCSLRVSKHVTSASFHFLHSCYVRPQWRAALRNHLTAFSSLRRRCCRSRRG